MGRKLQLPYNEVISLIRQGATDSEIGEILEIGVSNLSYIRHTIKTIDAEYKGETPISRFTPRELMTELAKRGYRGKLEYVQSIDITKF